MEQQLKKKLYINIYAQLYVKFIYNFTYFFCIHLIFFIKYSCVFTNLNKFFLYNNNFKYVCNFYYKILTIFFNNLVFKNVYKKSKIIRYFSLKI